MRNTLIINNLLKLDDLSILLDEFSTVSFTSPESNKNLSTYDVIGETKIFNMLNPVLRHICNELENTYRCKIVRDVGLAILKYEKDAYIDMHRDWEPNDSFVLKYNKPRVDIGCILYINDNYNGGEILFFNDKHDEKPFFSMKPNFGTCLLFDSSIYHMTSPVVSGVRYSATAFFQVEDR